MEIVHSDDRVNPRIPPGKRVHYVANNRSFGAFIRSQQMRSATAEVAQDIARMARALSPASKDGGDDGTHMRDQFEVEESAGFMRVGRNTRVQVDVVNGDRAAAPNEFGTSRTPRRRMLGRAGAAFGDFQGEL